MRPIVPHCGTAALLQNLHLGHKHHHPPKGVSVTVATVNDDFTDKKSSMHRVNAQVILGQETKNTRVRGTKSQDEYGVHQNFSRDDQAGTSVAWKRDHVKVVDSGYQLGVAPHGHALLNRWMNWTDMKIDGQAVRMISVHRPPLRDKALWPLFDKNLAAFVKSHKGPVIIGMDANERNPQEMARRTGLKWVSPPGSIDGFLVSPEVKVEKMWRLPQGASDHQPVVAKFRIRPPAKDVFANVG